MKYASSDWSWPDTFAITYFTPPSGARSTLRISTPPIWLVLGSMTSMFGTAGHGNALFMSAIIPFGLLAVGYGMPRLRVALAGLSVGFATHLAVAAMVPGFSVSWMPMIFGLPAIWLAVNAAACLGLARLALRR